jgi:hypothetical protein
MTQNVTAKVVAITRDDGSMSVEQMQDVLRFLDRLINGSLLDARNHDDDSLLEVAARCLNNDETSYTHRKLLTIDRSARELRKRLIGV